MKSARSTLILMFCLSLVAGAVHAKGKKSSKSPLDDLKLVAGDEKGNEVKSLKSELLISDAEKKAIAQAHKLMRKYKGTPLEADIEFRLAELYMRQSNSQRFFELHRESETVVRLAPAVIKSASSRRSVQRAVDLYGDIQKRFPHYESIDLVMFNHAFARQSLGQEKDAQMLFESLIAKHPKSELVPDAHLAIGEIAFNKGQFPVALEHFNAIQKYPQSRVYPYGLYKSAWTYYNMRDAAKGLHKLEEVVAYGNDAAKSGAKDARLDLRKEALNDMTLFFEDVYPSKKAYEYFSAQAGPEDVGPILLRMATLYERHSRFADQQIALQQFISELPDSPLLSKVNTDLVLAYDHLRKKDQAVERLGVFADLCRADGDWVKAQAKATKASTDKVAADCLSSLNETALHLATKWLRAWKKLPSDTTYADASEKAFQIYLKTPSTTQEYEQSRYAYADLLFSRQKYREASAQYAMVDGKGMNAKMMHDASYGAVVALEKAVGDKWSSADEKTFHQLAEDYVKKNPKGQYRLDVEYKMALLAYEKERYDEAAPIFLRLGRQYPKQEKGQKSQDLYLDILNIKKDYNGVRTYAAELLKYKADPARQQKLHKLYEQAYFLEIQGMEDKGQNQKAMDEYLKFARQNPNSDLTEKAVWNAMQLQFKLGDMWGGAKTAERFASQFPKSKEAVNALLRAAQTFEQMGQLSEAAQVLEQLATADAKSSARWKELAADFHALDGESIAARKLYQELRASSGKAKDRERITAKLETFEKNYGTEATHAAILKTMIDQNMQPQADEARVQNVENLLAKGKSTDAFNEARRLLGKVPAEYKARLRLVQAKILEQEFMKASVKAQASRVATVLAIKTEKLQKAQEAFQSAIKYGNPHVSVEAFERLYGCYSSYVNALKTMPTPKGLSADDEKVFRSELDNLVIPLEEKSVDTLAQAVEFAKKQNFLDGTANRLQRELDVLNKQSEVDVTPDLKKPGIVLPVLAGA